MAKEKVQHGVIEGVIVYGKIAQADKKYESEDTEFSIGIIVNEDFADDWETKFSKQPAKKIKAAEFEAKYKIPLPEEFKGEKNVYQITLKRNAVVDGEPFYPGSYPKVFLDTKGGERLDITNSRLIANGSHGKISYRINANKFGTFARLANVLFDEDGFIEYEAKGGPGAEFGEVKQVKVEPAKESVTSARPPRESVEEEGALKKPSKKESAQLPPAGGDFDDDIPF